MIRIAINGFGRIGKTFLRILMQDKKVLEKIKVVVINTGKGEPEAGAFAFKYDTLMGTYKGEVSYKDKKIFIDNYSIDVISELEPEKIDWANYNIDWVVDASGKFTKRQDARRHINSGAGGVLITAPSPDADIMLIPGVNLEKFDKSKHKIVSLASCTSNAICPMIKVLNDNFGIELAFMTTAHAYTNSQALLDVDATTKDLRKKRAAALNIVPTSTGASGVLDKIFPELAGKITATAMRVPVPKVSIIDLTAILKIKVSRDEINNKFKNPGTNFKNIIEFTQEPLVSNDYANNSHSVIIDGLLTSTNNNVVKVFGWYDNEWGYSERLKDFLLYTSQI